MDRPSDHWTTGGVIGKLHFQQRIRIFFSSMTEKAKFFIKLVFLENSLVSDDVFELADKDVTNEK